MRKSYAQYCPIAHALDLVGERWALLVVRELLDGPQRYTDLAGRLPGIGTNILADRLRDLEAAGVIRRTKLPPPAASTVYELTDYGQELEETLHALGRWGARSLGPPRTEEVLKPGWTVNAIRCVFNPETAGGADVTYELRLGGETAAMRVQDGAVEARLGSAEDPDLVLETDPPTLFRLVSRELAPADALEEGLARIEGEPAELERLLAMLSFEPRRLTIPA